jgi:hypothetical protein
MFDNPSSSRYNQETMNHQNATFRSRVATAIALALVSAIIASCIVQSTQPVSPELGGTLESLEEIVASQATDIAAQEKMISYLATRVPSALLSTREPVPTTYYPIVGSVVIEDDRCCAGGVAGDEIDLTARFEASSPFGEVTHMRVHSGSGPQLAGQMPGSIPWEPFSESRTFTTKVALNWAGFFVSVQFRDSAGNLSPIVWDDISIEGMPPATP